MKTKMYVIAHNKASAIPRLPSYVSLFVGVAIHGMDARFDERDDIGENISAKNPNYCELTGIYWIWKNSAADIVGISHYRRFFSKSAFFGSPKHFVTGEDMEALLAKKRMVLPKPRCYPTTMLSAINIAPNRTDLKEVYDAIQACAPDYTDDFILHFNQNKTCLFNMCIMRKADFDAYCAWLFPILAHVEARHDMDAETIPYRKRLYGFLSEMMLLPVWVRHNMAPSDVAELPVVNTTESDGTRVRRWCGNAYRNLVYALTKNGRRRKREHAELADALFGRRPAGGKSPA
jgi:hypothetical protein